MAKEHKITLHNMDAETQGTNDSCHWMMFQTRPINLETPHAKRLSKLVLRSVFQSFDDEIVPFLVYGSNVLNDWELINYQQCDGGVDVFTTRILGNYKFFMIVFAAGKRTLIQQIDTVYSERFTQTFR